MNHTGSSSFAKSLTRATQPYLLSPGGSEQAQRYHPASLSSESGYPVIQTRKYGDAESVRGRRPGPPVWKIPHEALSLARARARLIWHRESRPRFVTNSVVAKAV